MGSAIEGRVSKVQNICNIQSTGACSFAKSPKPWLPGTASGECEAAPHVHELALVCFMLHASAMPRSQASRALDVWLPMSQAAGRKAKNVRTHRYGAAGGSCN